MTLVGYDDNESVDINGNGTIEPEEKGVFKICNSWGAGDGPEGNGFRYISYDAVRTTSTAGCTATGRIGMFWGETVYTTTGLPNYKPKITAQFTVSTASRNEVSIDIGTSDTTATTPVSTFSTFMNHAGGAFLFDGTTSVSNQPMDGSFYLDISPVLPAVPANTRYYMGVNDNKAGNPSILKSYRINNLTYGGSLTSSDVPVTADGLTWSTYDYIYLDMAYGMGGEHSGSNVYVNLKGYPSPFNPTTASGGTFKIINIPINCEFSVHTVDGKQVRYLKEVEMSDPNAGWIAWDGKNDAGELVGRGIYVYSIKDASGNIKTGKIAVTK